MKFLLAILIIFALQACAPKSDVYSDDIRLVVLQLREIEGLDGKPEFGGHAVGYAGNPHPAYSLSRFIDVRGTGEDIAHMLDDEHPVVRIVGALCAVRRFLEGERPAQFTSLFNDETKLSVGEYGCGFDEMSVGDLVRRIDADPDLFESHKHQAEQVAEGNPPG